MAISIPAALDAELLALRTAMLPTSNDTAPSVPYASSNRVADLLEQLTDLILSATLTATGGTALSVEDTGAFTGVNSLAGSTVTFDAATTTAALQGVSAVVLSNTVNACFFSAALPDTPVAGDEYVVTFTAIDDKLADLRGGRSLGGGQSNPYGYGPTFFNAASLVLGLLGATVPAYLVTTGVEPFGSGSPHAQGTMYADALQRVRDAVAAYTVPA